MDFLGQLMHGHLTEWLKQRDGKRPICFANWSRSGPSDLALISHWTTARRRSGTGIQHPGAKALLFHGNRHRGRKPVLKVTEGKYAPAGQKTLSPIPFTYQGSILSQLKETVLTPGLLTVKRALQSIKSLEFCHPT